MLLNDFILLNDDNEYLIGYKSYLESKQVELVKLNVFDDEKLVRITLIEDELIELVNALK